MFGDPSLMSVKFYWKFGANRKPTILKNASCIIGTENVKINRGKKCDNVTTFMVNTAQISRFYASEKYLTFGLVWMPKNI